MQGFVIFDHKACFESVANVLAQLLSEGKLQIDEDIQCGLEFAPQALADLYSGRNTGKKLIKLDS
jgi:NADPH-dependent curcumin reductase